jgi:hypothetical protein
MDPAQAAHETSARGAATLARRQGAAVSRSDPVWPSRIAAGALALLGGACSPPDYTSVRDWARTASLAADYPSVSAPWVGVAVAPAPAPATTGADVPIPAPAAPGPAPDGVLAMQEALSVYLSAIGTLASDGVLPFREDPFARLAPRAAAADEAGGRAVAALGAFLRKASHTNMQAPEMRDAVVAADPTVQVLVTALSAAVARSSPWEAEDRAAAVALYARLEREARDPAARQAARDLAALRDREFAARAAARARYGLVLARIAEGHALLKARARRITQEEAIRQVRAAEDSLRRAAALLPRGTIADPAPAGCQADPVSPTPSGAGLTRMPGRGSPADLRA